MLSGDDGQAIVVQGGTVYLDLAPFVDAAKQRLSAGGLTAVDLIPEVHPTIAPAPADQLVRARSAYGALDSVATVLPWITLLLAVGVHLARVRMQAMVAAGLGVALALVLLAAGLLVARGLLVGSVPAAGAPAAASGFDILVRPLRDSGRVLLVLALVVALGAFLAGSSATAVGARRWASGLLGRIRGGPSATGPVGTWIRARVRGLRIGAVALAALLFVYRRARRGYAPSSTSRSRTSMPAQFSGRVAPPEVATLRAMSRVNDVGGQSGFGLVAVEPDEPPFHADWEARVYALNVAMLRRGVYNLDQFRDAIERMPPAEYLAASYYERWLVAVDSLTASAAPERRPADG